MSGPPSKQIAQLVKESAVGIVQKAIERAEGGDYRAMKYLFDLVGLFSADNADETEHQNSLAKILLRHLGVPDKMVAEEEAELRGIKPEAVPSANAEVANPVK